MKTVISKGRHLLGKLSRNCDKAAPRNCEAALTWELRQDGDKLEFSACGEVWNPLKTDIVQGGQCVDELAALFQRDVLAQRIRRTWAAYHLNEMNAGTPEQSAALEAGRAALAEKLRADAAASRLFYHDGNPNWHAISSHLGKGSEYDLDCEILRDAGMLEVPVTPELRASALGGLPEDAKVYRYGTRWLHRVIPSDVVALIRRGFQDSDGLEPATPRTADPEEACVPDLDLIEEAGLSVAAVFVPWSQSRNKGERSPSLNWRVTLQCKGRDVLTCDYSAGSSHCPASRRSFNTPTVNPANEKRDAIRQECETGFSTRGGLFCGQFKRGTAIKPDARAVISSLLHDAAVLDVGRFADWAAEYGMDADSIKARAVYDECIAHAVAFRAAVGPAMFDALRDANA